MNKTVTFVFSNIDPSLGDCFPTDVESDITLVFSMNKESYRLRKQILMRHSKYFMEYFTNERNKDSNIMLINQKFDPQVFENILRCFYGYKYMITRDAELYQAYFVANYLNLDSFMRLIEQHIDEHICLDNFVMVYQLCDHFNLDYLRCRCVNFLEEHPHAFTQLFDTKKLDLFQVRGPSMMMLHSIMKPPENVLMLNEDTFKRLITLHQQFKQVSFLFRHCEEEQIFRILKFYVKIRHSSPEERKDRLRYLVAELIDPEVLTSKQYQIIYHSCLLMPEQSTQMNNFSLDESQVEQFQQSFIARKNSPDKYQKIQQLFDPLMSDNKLLSKQLRESQEENKSLQIQLQSIKEENEELRRQLTTTQSSIQERFEKLDLKLEERIKMLMHLLENSKVNFNHQQSLLKTKDDIINSVAQFVQEPSRTDLMESMRCELQQLHGGSLQMSALHIVPLVNQSNISQQDESMTYKQNRLMFDSTPQCVFESKELHILLELMRITIFDQVSMELQYRGSRDGFTQPTIQLSNPTLYLVRTMEHERVFGYYMDPIDGHNCFMFDLTMQKHHYGEMTITCTDRIVLQFGTEVVLFEDCNNHADNVCTYIEGLGCVTGDPQFTVDEIEIYRVRKTSIM